MGSGIADCGFHRRSQQALLGRAAVSRYVTVSLRLPRFLNVPQGVSHQSMFVHPAADP